MQVSVQSTNELGRLLAGAQGYQLDDVARRGDRYPVEAFRHGLESTDGVSDHFSVDATAKKCASAKRRPNRFGCSSAST